MNKQIKLIAIKKLKIDKKKYNAQFEIIKPNGKISIKNIKFGAKGMSDYTLHKDKERRNRYIMRHTKDLRTNDPSRAGYLSMYILWNKPSFKSSLDDYKRRLNVYNRTGNFPITISGSSLKNNFGTTLTDEVVRNTYLDKLPPDIQEQLNKQVSDFNKKYISGTQERFKLRKLLRYKTKQLYRLSSSDGDDPSAYTYDWDPRDYETVDWLNMAVYILNKNDLKRPEWNDFVASLIVSYCEGSERDNNYYENAVENLQYSIFYLKVLINKLDINPRLKFGEDICSDKVFKLFDIDVN